MGKERQDGLHTFFHHNFKASILNLEVRSQDAKIPFSSELCPVEGATSVSLYAYNRLLTGYDKTQEQRKRLYT